MVQVAQVVRVQFLPSPSYELCAMQDFPRLGGAVISPVTREVKMTSLAVVGPAEMDGSRYNLTQVGLWWRTGRVW